jgi:hypothetical protein
MALVHGAQEPLGVSSGLVLYLDAANARSYPRTGLTLFDRSGNGNNGTLEGGVGYSGSNFGSFSFDGTDDFVQINNPTSFQNQNFTISAWINPGVQDSNTVAIIDFDHASTHGWVIQSESAITNRYYYLVWQGGGAFQPQGGFGGLQGIQVTTSVWQNIVYVKDGTSLLGYRNGSQVINYTAGTSNVAYQSNRNVTIAKGTVNTGREFTGSIAQVSIYNRALSATEIAQNYNALKSRYI